MPGNAASAQPLPELTIPTSAGVVDSGPPLSPWQLSWPGAAAQMMRRQQIREVRIVVGRLALAEVRRVDDRLLQGLRGISAVEVVPSR